MPWPPTCRPKALTPGTGAGTVRTIRGGSPSGVRRVPQATCATGAGVSSATAPVAPSRLPCLTVPVALSGAGRGGRAAPGCPFCRLCLEGSAGAGVAPWRSPAAHHGKKPLRPKGAGKRGSAPSGLAPAPAVEKRCARTRRRSPTRSVSIEWLEGVPRRQPTGATPRPAALPPCGYGLRRNRLRRSGGRLWFR
jgi:hypothetical protein